MSALTWTRNMTNKETATVQYNGIVGGNDVHRKKRKNEKTG